MSGIQQLPNDDVGSEVTTSRGSIGETVSEAPTYPTEDGESLITGTSQATGKSKSKARKHPSESKKDKMPKTNILVDCYHTELELLIPNNAIGRDLFEQVVVSLGLKEVWFFGLEYLDSKKSPVWLKLKKKVFAQDVGKKRPVCFKFKPKFFPEDVEKELIDSVAKKLFLEHIKAEIVSGDLHCAVDTAVLLASFGLQEQHGNYNAVLNPKGFLHNQKVLPSKVNESHDLPPQEWEEKIVRLYKDHRGMSKEQATMEYLRIAQDLEMFGVNYFPIKNKKSTPLWLGVDALGINVYEKNNKLDPKTGFPWSEIKAISYRDKRFTIKPIYDETPSFVFYTDKSKTNKTIMILCMGNHELYIRRRKIDVAPKERLSSARLADINTIIEEDPQQSTSNGSEDHGPERGSHTLNGYSNEYENDDVFTKHEEPKSDDEAHKRESSPLRKPSPVRRSSPVRKRDSSPRQKSPVRNRSPSPIRQNTPAVHSEEPEYATVERDAEDDEETAVVHDRPPTPPAQRPTTDAAFKEAKQPESELSTLHQASNFKQNSVYEPVGNTPLSAVTEVPDSPPTPSEDNKHGVRFSLENRGSRDYVELIAKYEQGGMLSEDYYDREVYVNENKEMYYKLKNLFEDVSADPTKLSEEDKLFLQLKKENVDKYQTLRKIRSGYARNRIAIFEAMI